MASYFLSLLLCLCFVITFLGALTSSVAAAEKQPILFVFGDSTADTGNTKKYRFPYGLTYPGFPSGRASNGRVSVDFLAHYMNIEVPVAYEKRDRSSKRNGINFAYGGAAVFKTDTSYPTIGTQVKLFRQMIKDKVYSQDDLKSSTAIISYGGNDYSYAVRMDPPKENNTQYWMDLMEKVVTELQKQLQRVHKLGVPKVIINTLAPLGCVPQQTVKYNYTTCATTPNQNVKNIHNSALYKKVKELNRHKEIFFVIDYYKAVSSIIEKKGADGIKFEQMYEPCCKGSCGVVNTNGSKEYVLCEDPNTSFYWDFVHFSDQGWRAIYLLLKNNLKNIFSS